MSGKYQRQIRKLVNQKQSEAVETAIVYLRGLAQQKRFFQRLRVALRYVFKRELTF